MSMLYVFVNILLFICSMPGHVSSDQQKKFEVTKIADDGAWLWFNNESVIILANTIYIACEDVKGNAKVITYPDDSEDESSVKSYKLSTWNERNRRYPTHNYPSVVGTKNGLLTIYHNSTDQMFLRSASIQNNGKNDQQLVWSEESVVKLNSGMNYSNLVFLRRDNKLYNFFSIYTNSPSFVTTDDFGKTWSKEIQFLGQGASKTSPYMRINSNSRDRVDILYTDGHPRNEPGNSVYHMYFFKDRFFSSDGKEISSITDPGKMPVSPQAGTKVYEGIDGKPGWVWDIETDTRGNPVAAFITSEDGPEGKDMRYHFARWNKSDGRWTANQIAYAGSHIYVPENHFAGGITIDPENTNIVYISSNVDPSNGETPDSSRYQIYRGMTNDNGISWTWEQITFGKSKDHFRPIVPKNHKNKNCVVWFSREFDSEKNLIKYEVLGIIN